MLLNFPELYTHIFVQGTESDTTERLALFHHQEF